MSHPQLQYSLFQQNPKNTTEKKTGLNCKIPKYLYALIRAFKPQLQSLGEWGTIFGLIYSLKGVGWGGGGFWTFHGLV